MIDHIYLPVTDLKRSDTFYGGMLGPLGMSERWHFKAQAGYPGLWRAGHSGLLAEGLKDHLRRALRRIRREERGGNEQGVRGSACQWRQG